MKQRGTPRRYRGNVRVSSTGLRQHTMVRHLPESPPPGGPHQWVVAGVWRLSAEAAAASGHQTAPINLDLENLMSIDGPGCWVCEQSWSEKIADLPCPGEPNA